MCYEPVSRAPDTVISGGQSEVGRKFSYLSGRRWRCAGVLGLLQGDGIVSRSSLLVMQGTSKA